MLDRVFDEKEYGPLATEHLRAAFEELSAAELAEALVGGMTKREFLERHSEPTSVRFHVMDLDDFLLGPLPNHLFTRDTSAWIYDGVSINAHALARPAARDRPLRGHLPPPPPLHRPGGGRLPPLVGGPGRLPLHHRGRRRPEVIGQGAVLIGMSERTTPQAVEMLARGLFDAGSARTIVALDMPKARAFMHLDTVMTMVDGDTFTQYAGLGMLRSYTIEPGSGPRELKVTDHPPEHMHRAIAAALGLDEIRVLTATQDVHAAEREQWDDGCNVLAVEPGVVVAYERNATTNTYLRKRGHRGDRDPGQRTGPGTGRAALYELPGGAGPRGMSRRRNANPGPCIEMRGVVWTSIPAARSAPDPRPTQEQSSWP